MSSLFKDLRHAARQLMRRPAFAAAAIGSLALGIGLNTTLFSVVNAVLLKDGHVADKNALVEIYSDVSKEYPQLTTSYPDFLDIRQGTDALAGVAANAYVRGILSTQPSLAPATERASAGQAQPSLAPATEGASAGQAQPSLASAGQAQQATERPVLVTGESVTANYFDVLGIAPVVGRGFLEEEARTPDAAPVVVLSHGLWQRRLGGRASIVGETIRLSGVAYTVVGVAPPGFTGTLPGIPTEFWVPIMMVERLEFSGVQTAADVDPGATRLERRGTRWLFVKGRLRDGRSIEQARAQIETIFARLRAEYPATNEDVTASVLPAADIRFHPMLDRYFKAASVGLLTAVGLVLLIACANVANMLLARGVSRRRELAVRAALGASRGRLIGHLLMEALVLAGIGGALGLLIAWWSGRALSGVGTTVFPMPIRFDFSIDRTVLAFAGLASLATAVLFGVAPAWSSSKLALVPALKETAEGDRRRRVSIRDLLVVAQLALSLVLLVAGALLARGLLSAHDTDLGFDPTPVASLSFNLQMNGYDTERATALRDRALDSLKSLPGVIAVSTASRLPLAPDIMMEAVHVPGHHGPNDDGAPVDTVSVGSDYFTVVGVPIVTGRAFNEDDERHSRRVAIVNQAFARRFWPDGSAVGRLIHISGLNSPPLEIVGIARDHKVRSVGEEPRPYLHVPAGNSRSISLVVRTRSRAVLALPMLREALWKLEPDIVFTEDASAEQVAATTIAPTRLGAMALGAFGLLALLLAGVGVYGVLAYSVSRRTREIGVRMALGAARGQVLRMVLRQGGRLAMTGIAVGLIASAGIGQLLESLLYGVSGFDPVAYSIAAGTLLCAAGAANLVPAITASRVDPMRALASE